jgi:hypothetical protein
MRRAGFVVAGGTLAALLVLVTLPAFGDAASRWPKPEPVRSSALSVDDVRPGSAPAGMRPPAGRPPLAPAGEAAVPAVVDAGMTFNLVGATGRLDATRGGLPQADDQDGESQDAHVTIRTSMDGETWSEWFTLPMAGAAGDVSARNLISEPCWVGEGRYVQFADGGPVSNLKLVFVNSLGETSVADRVQSAIGGLATTIAGLVRPQAADAGTTQPKIVTRAQWGADESWRRADPEYAPVKMAFIHHTVSGNSYSRSQAPAVVRGIYRYHVYGADFNDIGYNFLIDRYGTIYEGRYGGITQGVIGAQTLGFNTNSTGVALIGTYSSASPPSAAATSLKRLLAWKLDVHHVNPNSTATLTCRASEKYDEGQTVRFKTISGHRDANFTSCPGYPTYAKLPSIRSAVAAIGLPKIYNPAASPAIFTPDGDGQGDTSTLRFSASETVSWRMQVSDAGGAVVRSWSGSGSSVSRAWDGNDASGAQVPDGAYTVKATATSSRGTARAASFTTISDTTPPEISSLTFSPATSGRTADGHRQSVRVAYTVSEAVQARVTVRTPGGSPLGLIGDWRWVGAGRHSATWNGNITFAGVKIPAPDGTYTILIQVRDVAGNAVSSTVAVPCESDPALWGDGTIFCTKALRAISITRGKDAVLRYMAVLAPPQGEKAAFTTAAKVTIKVRDAAGKWRYTRSISNVPLNQARSHTWTRCLLPRGTYKYYVYAKLADGTTQQLVGSAKLTVK